MARIVKKIEIAAGDSLTNWIKLNQGYNSNEDAMPRVFTGKLTSGDSITVDVSLDEDPNTSLETFGSSSPYSTTDFQGLIEGGWSWIRFRKTGTNGVATIKFRE